MKKLFRYTRETTLAIACATFAGAFFYYAQQPINHDVAWFMYAARGMLAGGRLYRDYVEINAPMAYISLLPAAALSRLPEFSNEAALTLTILAYIFISYFLCLQILRTMRLTDAEQIFLPSALLVIMEFLPHYAFGQREHIFAVLTLPYVLAAALRSENCLLPPTLAIACGIAAGFGASIKPPFLIVPAFIEAAVLLRQRSWKIVFTYDVLALTISAALIYLSCYLAYPVYWQKILPSMLPLYAAYNNSGFIRDALQLLVPLFAIGLMTGTYRGHSPLIATRWMLIAASLGAFALFLLQRKGWPYHAQPVLLFASALFAFNLAGLKWGKRMGAKNLLRASAAIAALVSAFAFAFIFGNVEPSMLTGIREQLDGTDGSFYIMSTGNYPAFPLALDPRTRWTSRFPQLILLPGLIKAELDGAPSPEGPAFRAAVLEDLRRNKPATVFVYEPVDAGGITGQQMLYWLARDQDFDREWQTHYRWTDDLNLYLVFRRTD
jgi:hypothetical protein